jgi:capsular exopolysaccharide synthesis family protein
MIANTYVSEFIQFNLQRKFESSSYARDFLANQLVEVKKKLEDSERDLNAYSRSAGLIRMTVAPAGNTVNTNSATQQSGSVTTSSLIQVNQAANEAKARRIAIEERWNAISHGPLMSTTEVVTNQGIQQLLSQKSVIVSTLEQDKARHLSDYPTVRAEEAQLAAINNQIQNAATSIRNAVKSEYTAAVAAESDLNAQVNGLKSETLNEQDRTVRYGLLAREVDTNREVYDALLQRYKELNASAGISASNIWIIDAAVPPLKASTPDLLKNSVIGFVLALIITATVVVIKDQFDDSIRIPEEIESKLKLTLMGVVPQTTGELVDQMADPKSSFTEAYNSIRGSMLFATSHGLPRSFMVTSAQPGEGKTTTSFALSTALARAGKRVVLIDGDLRRPALHRWVNEDNEQGLSTLLISDASVVSAARPTATANLFVIPAGPIPPSPTEMLSSPRMVEVMREASEVFDVVIIDSAPVLGLADAPMIAAMTEGILFVVEADRTRHGSLKGALRRLVSVRKPIFGAVLTKFDPFKGSNRYGSYYGYEYYQYQYSYHNTDRAE